MKRTLARSKASDSKAAPVRIDGVTVRTVGHELVVYDPDTTSTHVLNPVAAAVFDAVDGARSRGELALNATLTMGEPVSSDQVDRALADLGNAGLVRVPASDLARRRLLIGGAAAGALAVPTVLSVLAPSPAAAMSGDGGGTTGGGGSDGGVDGGADGGMVTTTTAAPPPNPVGDVTTLAGDGGFGDRNGPGDQAQFGFPVGMAVGLDGTLYIADPALNRIRAIDPATGVVTTYAGTGGYGSNNGSLGTATFANPSGVAVAPDGTMYVADSDNNMIRAINPVTGAVSTLAGDGIAGFADGPGNSARFNGPNGVAVGADGTVYVADLGNDRIRAIHPVTGVVSTLAGTGEDGFADGPGNAAKFGAPYSVAVGTDGTVYVADSHTGRIRAIDPTTGVVSTLAGSGLVGSDDGPGSTAKFYLPCGVGVGPNGTVYVADTQSHRIRAINPTTGEVSTLAGSSQGFAEGVGVAAKFNRPFGVAVGADGTVYVADSNNSRIRKIT